MTTDGQSSLMDFGVPVLSEKSIALIKKISKLTGEPQSKYNSLPEKELEELFEKVSKEQAEIKELTKQLEKFSLAYDSNKSLEENKEDLEAAIYKSKHPVYKYPFRIYFKGNDIQEPDHIFELGTEYSDKDIIQRMFKNGYKEFSGNVKINYDQEDNMIIPEFASQKHG